MLERQSEKKLERHSFLLGDFFFFFFLKIIRDILIDLYFFPNPLANENGAL